jgi:hypothetical protein
MPGSSRTAGSRIGRARSRIGVRNHAVNAFVTVILTESRCLSTMLRMPRTRASNSAFPHHNAAVTQLGSVLTCRGHCKGTLTSSAASNTHSMPKPTAAGLPA